MTDNNKAAEYIADLKRYQSWRRGEDTRTMDEIGLTPKRIGAALDWAIKELEAR